VLALAAHQALLKSSSYSCSLGYTSTSRALEGATNYFKGSHHLIFLALRSKIQGPDQISISLSFLVDFPWLCFETNVYLPSLSLDFPWLYSDTNVFLTFPSQYEPELFPGLINGMKQPKIVLLISVLYQA